MKNQAILSHVFWDFLGGAPGAPKDSIESSFTLYWLIQTATIWFLSENLWILSRMIMHFETGISFACCCFLVTFRKESFIPFLVGKKVELQVTFLIKINFTEKHSSVFFFQKYDVFFFLNICLLLADYFFKKFVL